MKSRLVSIFHTLAALALLCGLISLPSSQPVAAPLSVEPKPETLIMLSAPDIANLNIPPGLSVGEARRMALELIEYQAQPVLAELRRLLEAGQVSAFELRAEQNTVAVWSDLLLSELKVSPLVSELLSNPASATCGLRTEAALESQIYHRSQSLALSQRPQQVQATNPSIHVYAPNQADYTYVYGLTAPSTQVVMRILRGGVEIYTESLTSHSDGDYYFYPDWGGSCEYQGYNWLLQPGDEVEVTAAGSTVSTEVAFLESWMDASTDVIGGLTNPGRTMNTNVYWSQDPCNSDTYTMTVSPDAYGYFYADFSTFLDFDGRAYGFVDALDSNGNSTFVYPDAFSITYFYDYDEVDGVITPNTAYTAELYRGPNRLDFVDGTSDAEGDIYFYFDQIPQAADVINISFDYQPGTLGVQALSLSLTLAPLSAALSAATDQVTGTTSPGELIYADFNLRTWGNVITTCDYDYECASASADGGGNFTLNSALDLQRGDYVYIVAYNDQGNAVSNRFHAPVLAYHVRYDELGGYWGAPWRDLTATLMDNAYNVKSTYDTSSYGSGSFYAYFYEDVLPGDIIEVGDGTVTETMTVFDFAGTLDSSTELLSGSSGGDRLLAEYYDFDRHEAYYEYGCFDLPVVGGSYSIDLSSSGVEAQDDANVYSIGGDGHYMTGYLSAFRASISLPDGEVSGYTMLLDTPVTINLWDGAVLLETYSIQSYYGSYYETLTNTLQTGLRLEVLADGLVADITIPELSINADPLTNSLYGNAPANEPIELQLVNRYQCFDGYDGWCGSYFYVQTEADGAGTYNQSFDSLSYWDSTYDVCRSADVDGWCAERSLYYYQPDEHQVIFNALSPDEVADAYETDDTPAEATLYEGLTAHTFHTEDDQDWFAIPVSDEQVGMPLYIHTLLLGPNADTYLYLYDTDGSTILASDDDDGYGRSSFLTWTPPAAGTYYVKVEPYYYYYAVRCGTGYSFVVSDVMTVLPIVAR